MRFLRFQMSTGKVVARGVYATKDALESHLQIHQNLNRIAPPFEAMALDSDGLVQDTLESCEHFAFLGSGSCDSLGFIHPSTCSDVSHVKLKFRTV